MSDPHLTLAQQQIMHDMLAEYESSSQCLEDELRFAFRLEPLKQPIVAVRSRDLSPLERKDSRMMAALEDMDVETSSSSSSSSSPTAAGGAVAFTGQGLVTQQPRPADDTRGGPSAANPWYITQMSICQTIDTLFHILKSVRHTLHHYNTSLPPPTFQALAAHAFAVWHAFSPDPPELRQIATGLAEVAEFLTYGPRGWDLARELAARGLQGDLVGVVEDAVRELEVLAGREGCGWLGEVVGGPLGEVRRLVKRSGEGRVEEVVAAVKGMEIGGC